MANKGRVKSWIEYGGLRGIFLLFRILPRSVAIKIGKGAMRIGFRILGRQLKAGMRNLEIAFPESTESERKTLLRRSIENLGRTTVEFARFRPVNAEESRSKIGFDFDSEEFQAYKDAKAAGRGVLMPTAHIGNWEVLLSGFALHYEPIYFMARELDNPLIDKMFADVRARYGSLQFYKSDSSKEVLKALRSGKSVGVLPDVNVHPKEGVFVPFFDVPACTTSGVARLAISANALIFPMFAIWDDGEMRYVVYNGKPIEPANTGERERDVLETTAAFTTEIEKIIRRFPEQWMWIHKRWKIRPPGEPELY
ncbi:MAG: lysophospholipid acyltransferase family protein [Pyrinomonadaceae bacterium]